MRAYILWYWKTSYKICSLLRSEQKVLNELSYKIFIYIYWNSKTSLLYPFSKDNKLIIFFKYFLYFWNPLIFSWCSMSTNAHLCLVNQHFQARVVLKSLANIFSFPVKHTLCLWSCLQPKNGSQISFNSQNTHPSAIVVDPTAEVLVHVHRDPFNNVINKVR